MVDKHGDRKYSFSNRFQMTKLKSMKTELNMLQSPSSSEDGPTKESNAKTFP